MTCSSCLLNFYCNSNVFVCFFALLLTVDPSVGRLDYSLMSDQSLMEMRIEILDDISKKKYKDNDGMYLDACDWSVIKCNGDERVI